MCAVLTVSVAFSCGVSLRLQGSLERYVSITSRKSNLTARMFQFILICCLTTLLLPSRILAKLIYAVFGFIFWHVTPVVASMSPKDRARLVSRSYEGSDSSYKPPASLPH
jgi:hypothetical protein